MMRDGRHLEYVKVQDESLCLAAVTQDGLALLYVMNKTPAICMRAARKSVLD